MDFALSGEQQQFAATLHEMLTAAQVPAAARRWAAGDHEPGLVIWRALAQAGVTALAVPQACGGLGADPVDLVIACEELGHHAVPGPVAESIAAVPELLAALAKAGPSADAASVQSSDGSGVGQCGGWLARLATGELIATMASPPRLTYAADTGVAGLILLAGPQSVALARPGVQHRSVDAARTLSEVTGGQLLADGPQLPTALARALDFGTLACAAQLLGAGRALLQASAEHAGQRVQFGKPVGTFQAVKHQLADVLIGLEFARPLLRAAAISLRQELATAARDVSAAKVACTDAASRAARTALQVHGAIGYTAEHDVSLWLTKVRALSAAWGSQAEHRARVLTALADSAEGGPACG